MSGKLLNNKQIDALVKQGVIGITPRYDVSKLQIAQYSLSPFVVWEIDSNHNLKKVFQFSANNNIFKFLPKKYYLIDALEVIKLPEGIIGRFIPSSIFIEKGLTITSGKIEYPYGQKNERIRFGVFNCLDIETSIENFDRIVHVEFFDLRGSDFLSYDLSNYDKNIYNDRIYYDADGPNYEADNHDE